MVTATGPAGRFAGPGTRRPWRESTRPRSRMVARFAAAILLLCVLAPAATVTLREMKRPGDKFALRVALPKAAAPHRVSALFSLRGEPSAAQAGMPVAFRVGGLGHTFQQLSPTEFVIPGTIPDGLAAGVYELTEVAVETFGGESRTHRGAELPHFEIEVENSKIEDYRSIQKPIAGQP